MIKLTARQQQILDLLRDAISHTGFPPTRAEIAAQLGFSSPNAAEEHLRALARKGVIELTPGASRGIRLVDDEETQPRKFSIPALNIMQLSLPLVGRVAAGQPILATEHVQKHYQFDASMFAKRPDYLLRVRGMSMRDAGIFDGDLLAVQKNNEARNGQIVVARIGEEVTVKRLQKHAQYVELIAENPDYENIIVRQGEEDFTLEGIAVGLIRDSDF